MTNASVDLFTRLIKQKHSALINASHELLRALSSEDLELKKSAAEAMLGLAEDLSNLMTPIDRPAWLNESILHLKRYAGGTWRTHDFLLNHIPLRPQLEEHIWVFDSSDRAPFDFDAIYEHYKAESRLTELFNELVRILEEIHGSGAVDSLTMLNALSKVIATLKRGKDGSYFSLNSAWSFLMNFLTNYMWAELSRVPILGTVLSSLQKTIEETDAEMIRVHHQVEAEMADMVARDIKPLASKTQFTFVTYGRSGQVPTTSTPLLTHTQA